MLDFRVPETLPPRVESDLLALRAGEIDPPRSLTPDFYTAPAVLAAETPSVFLSGWICIGRGDEVSAPGDYVVTEIMGESLILTRDMAGTLRVLSNVCRHRGSLLLEGKGSTRRITCPYHAWTYGLDGGLIRAPLIKADTSTCNLPGFAVEEWMGWVFVNLDGQAPSLSGQLVDLDPYVRNYHPEEMRAQSPAVEIWPVNWKCLAENFMEGYHLTPVHLRTLHPMTPTRLCEKLPGGASYTGYKAHYDPAFEGRSEVHPDMTPQECRVSMMVWIYPGFVAAISPNSAVTMSLTPTGPEEVQTRWDVIVRPTCSAEEATTRHAFAASFNVEDKERLINVQRGLRSAYATGGPLAPADYEGTIWDFYQWMAGRLLGGAP